ncbi:MAG: right-handed parallel beta-helix repeat-containing protein [Duncaniella sp.]|nr:right-handed parallel beta-helix repeat-containing protein [Duncaniella sp.]
MKKSLFAMVAVGAVTLASCSSEEMAGPAGNGDGNVIITAQLPTELQSRAYGDGTVAKTLSYAVYDGDDVIFASDVAGSPAPVIVDAKNFTLSLNLVKGKTYDLLFWADATTGSPYTFTSSTKSVTVNYDNLGNNENRDAFFQAVKGLTVNGPVQQTVELRRPFAQVNIGTNDLADAKKAGLEVATTTMTVSGVYDTLNLFTGVASASEDVTLTYTAAVPENETFPVNGYEYLAMNYILSGTEVTENDVQAASRELIDITYKVTCTDGHEIDYSFTNVPVQRNYRTNIYGSLLTNPADFNIIVIPGFNDPDNNVEVKNPVPAGKVRIGEDIFDNLTDAFAAVTDNAVVELAASDYDTKGATWPKNVTFTIKGEGKDLTILSNLTDNTGVNGSSMTFENLTLNVEENPYTGTCFGFIHTVDATYNNVRINGEFHLYASGTETFNNCDFTYNAASDPKKGGRYAAWCYGSRNAVFNNCTFKNDFNAKAILVYGAETSYNRNVTVKNCKFTAAEEKDNGAIEIHTETFNGACAGTIIIENSTCTGTYQKGMWNEINNTTKEATTTFKVIVDNETVQEGISVDPKP